MATGQQTAIQIARGFIDQGMSSIDANIEVVRMMGVNLVTKIPSDIRRGFNLAVKNGRLGHLKKDGLKPEAYFHPNAKSVAIDMRNQKALADISAIRKICI